MSSDGVALVGPVDDGLLLMIRHRLRHIGAAAEIYSHVDYARRLTVEVCDCTVRVTPDRPLLLRQWSPKSEHPLSPFKLGELYSHLWSGAALTRSPVLNRPREFGWVSASSRILVARLWILAPLLRHLIVTETYSSAPHISPADEVEWVGAGISSLDPGVAARVRLRLPSEGAFIRLVAVGDEIIGVPPTAELPDVIRGYAADIAKSLGLGLAQLTFRIENPGEPLDGQVKIARISSNPSRQELWDADEAVAESAARYLVS